MLVGLRNSAFDRAAADAFMYVMSEGQAGSIRLEDAVQFLYNLQASGYGLRDSEVATYAKVAAAVSRICATASAELSETAQEWAAAARSPGGEMDAAALREELLEYMVPTVASVSLATWSRCVGEEKELPEELAAPL